MIALFLKKLKKVDLGIVMLMAIFMVLSTLVVYSATIDQATFHNSYLKNMINYGIGFVLMFGVMFFDYRILLKASYYYYAVGVFLLVAVYQFGSKINGARGWFKLPLGFSFQPAELMKLILIFMIAYLLAKRRGETLQFWRDIVPIGIVTFIPFALVLIQPDLGNALSFVVILIGMYWIGNVKFTHALIGFVLIAGFLSLFLYLYNTYHDDIKDYLKANGNEHWIVRIDTYLNPDKVSSDESYQVDNSIRAVGSGGLTGEGYLKGTSIHNRFIPLAYSDSIFVVVGEEFGFVGSSVLLLLYFLLIYRMIMISIQSAEMSGGFIVIGIVSMLVFQIFENIGMSIGLMPVTGVTLPFISYGGTSLLINMLCIGLIMSIRIHQDSDPEY